jgi:hypothetical protein
MLRPPPNHRFERSRGRILGEARREVDDWDKPASFIGNATPRRSTSSLDGTLMNRFLAPDARLIQRQRRLFRYCVVTAGLIALISYVPSFIHEGALDIGHHNARRVRFLGLLIASLLVSTGFAFAAIETRYRGYCVTNDRIFRRQTHRLPYLTHLTINILMALLAPMVFIALFLSGVRV